MANKYYIGYYQENSSDGGMARNKAFLDAFERENAIIINTLKGRFLRRIFHRIRVYWILLSKKSKTIFLHQSSFGFLFPISILDFKIINILVFNLFHRAVKRNKLVLEVNDLVYEQAIDLELKVDKRWEELEKKLYSIKNCNYIFASHAMRKYAIEMFKIPAADTSVIINGGPQLKDYNYEFKSMNWIDTKNVKYVYAGSLNKGRQIEELIQLFKENNNATLILIGIWGDWIESLDIPDNIIYLGAYPETEAHYLVAQCDIGIIPYDSNRFYYNLCYPTKASFYLTAGIPILSTPLKELADCIEKDEVVKMLPFDEWDSFIKNSDKELFRQLKANVIPVKESFYWENLIKFDY